MLVSYKTAVPGNLVVQRARARVPILRMPVESKRSVFSCLLGHSLDQQPRGALAARRLIDIQILEIAYLTHPNKRMEEVVGDADDPPVNASRKRIYSVVHNESPPGLMVARRGKFGAVERFIGAG